MKRKEFLEKIGLGAAFVLTASCMGSCSSDMEDDMTETDPEVTDPGNGSGIDFTLDLTDSANTNLRMPEGYVIVNDTVVAQTKDGEYVAATVVCSHQGFREIIFNSGEWRCSEHGARFNLGGDGLNNNGSKGLKIYDTELTGDMLRVFES